MTEHSAGAHDGEASPPNPSGYPRLAERREFARKVAAWTTGLFDKDARGRLGVLRRR